MATPTGNETFLTVTDDASQLPNSRQLTADPFADNLELLDGGPGGHYQLVTTGNLKSVTEINASGFLAYNSLSETFSPRTFTGDSTISVSNANGATTNPIIAVNDNTSIQRVNVASGGSVNSTRSTLNFINGNDITISVTDDGTNDRSSITISSSGASALDAKYVLNVPDVDLPNAQALSALSTGLMKVTTTTGIISTAVAGTDYVASNTAMNSLSTIIPAGGDLITSTIPGTYSRLGMGTLGQVLTSTGLSIGWQTPSSGAPSSATYILQTADAGLPSAQDLSALSTGILKVTTSTGVLSTAVSGTDYITPTPALSALAALPDPVVGNVITSTAGGTYSNLPIGTNGQVLTSNGTIAQWATPGAASLVIQQVIQTISTNPVNATQFALNITTVTTGGPSNVLQLDIPNQPDGSWVYVQVTPASTFPLSVNQVSTVIATITPADNALHYFVRLNGTWVKVY